MKNKILLLVVIIVSYSCNSSFIVSKSSRLTINKNVEYLLNDSLHLKYEFEWNNYGNDSTNPSSLNKIQNYILHKLRANTQTDLILGCNNREIIVLRKTPRNINEYRTCSVFDTTFTKYLPISTLKKFYRKTYIVNSKKLYIIEDVYHSKKGDYSFVYFDQNESKGGSSAIDPTDNDDILFFSVFYKHSLEVTQRNIVQIIKQEIKEL